MASLVKGSVYRERPFPNWLDTVEPNAVTNAVKQAKNSTPEERKSLFQIVTDLWVNHMLKSAPKPTEIPGLLNGLLELSRLVGLQDSTQVVEKLTLALVDQFVAVRDARSAGNESELGEINTKIKTLDRTIRIIKTDIQAMVDLKKSQERASQELADMKKRFRL
jgi:hypothetical protein